MIQMYYLTNFKVFLHFLPEIHLEILLPVGIRIILFFLDQSYPNSIEMVWTTQTEGLIQIKTRIGFHDLIWFQNPSFPFEQPIFKIWSNPITKIRSDYLWTTGPSFDLCFVLNPVSAPELFSVSCYWVFACYFVKPDSTIWPKVNPADTQNLMQVLAAQAVALHHQEKASLLWRWLSGRLLHATVNIWRLWAVSSCSSCRPGKRQRFHHPPALLFPQSRVQNPT